MSTISLLYLVCTVSEKISIFKKSRGLFIKIRHLDEIFYRNLYLINLASHLIFRHEVRRLRIIAVKPSVGTVHFILCIITIDITIT